MENTLEQTKREIAQAASEAVKVIAKAASETAKVVAEAAAVSVKVFDVKNASDHDLLIELKTRMEGLKEDVKEVNNGVSKGFANHEIRINKLETKDTRATILISLGIGLLTILTGILIYHLFGVKI